MTEPTLQNAVAAFERGDFSALPALESSGDPDLLAVAKMGRLLQHQHQRWERREEILLLIVDAMMSVASGDFRIDPHLDSGDEMLDSIMLALGMTAEELDATYHDLESARDEAMRASATKSQFLASMSHEFRTPLNAIIGYTELIQEDAEGDGLDQIFEDTSRVLQASRHLLALISDVLDISKIEANRIELDPEEFSVALMCQELCSVIEPLSKSRQNDFQSDFSDDLGVIYNDRTRLHQVLLNLLSNANKFTQQGVVRFDARREDKFLLFSIQDSGIGISQERLEHIFDPFTQEDSSTTRRFGGTGLGLSISRRLIELLGGQISVESTSGVGSCFTVQLPLNNKGAISRARPSGLGTTISSSSSAEAKHVMLIDDDLDIHEIMSRTLSSERYILYGHTSGIDALAAMETFQPDVILLDICLPKIDGWEVLRRIRANPSLSHIPVIIISIIDDKLAGYELGVSEHMTKPLNYDKLSKTMEMLCASTSGTILIIDDDTNARDLARRALEPAGFKIVEATDGLHAISVLQDTTPDVILLDLMMPNMDGFEFHQHLQRQQHLQNIPTIVLSAKQLTPQELHALSTSERILKKAEQPYAQLSKLIEHIVHPA